MKTKKKTYSGNIKKKNKTMYVTYKFVLFMQCFQQNDYEVTQNNIK